MKNINGNFAFFGNKICKRLCRKTNCLGSKKKSAILQYSQIKRQTMDLLDPGGFPFYGIWLQPTFADLAGPCFTYQTRMGHCNAVDLNLTGRYRYRHGTFVVNIQAEIIRVGKLFRGSENGNVRFLMENDHIFRKQDRFWLC